jgi:glycosyltransferase involved in cell wall biosynthesis
MPNKFSIIIPVHNSEKTLGKTLDSCLTQSYANFEIICIDDCSTDNSPVLLRQYAAKDNRIHCIFLDRNINLFMVRKTGMQYITGDYILFLDSDDTFTLDAFQLLSNKIRHRNADIVFFGFTNIPDGNKILPFKLKTPDEYLDLFFTKDSYIPSAVWTRAYKKELICEAFSKTKDFSAFMAEDVYIAIICHCYAKNVEIINKTLINYSTNGYSNITAFNPSVYKSWLLSYKTILDQIVIFIKENKPEYLKYCNNIGIRFIREFFAKIPSNLSPAENVILANLLQRYTDANIFYLYLREAQSRWMKYHDFCNIRKPRIIQLHYGIKYLIKCILGLKHFYDL